MKKLSFRSLLHKWNMDFGAKKRFICLANLSFDCMFKVADCFHMLPFYKTKDGEYIAKTGKKLQTHCIVHVIGLVVILQKIWATLEAFVNESDALTRVFSMFVMILQVGCYIGIRGVLVQPHETVDLLNSWNFLEFIGTKEEVQKKQIVDHPKLALKLIEINCAIVLCMGITMPLASVALNSPQPVFWHVFAVRRGIVPDYIGQRFFWKLLFLPIELITFFPLACLTAYTADLFVVGFENHKKLVDDIRYTY